MLILLMCFLFKMFWGHRVWLVMAVCKRIILVTDVGWIKVSTKVLCVLVNSKVSKM